MSHAESPFSEKLLSLFRERRSIRCYRPDPVPDEMVKKLLEAGRWAPSANDLQPWIFIVVRDETIRHQIAEYTTYHHVPRTHVADAPVLIVLCGIIEDRVYHEFLNGEVAMAGLQMMLQAKALGLGTCWVGGMDHEAVASILRVPDYFEIVALLTVGFPDEDPEAPPRKTLEEIVYYELYGGVEGAQDLFPGVPAKAPPDPLEKPLSRLKRLLDLQP